MAYSNVTYFGYGSNLDATQMSHRCPGARFVGTATLDDHQLVFRGYSARWGGSVATVRRRAGSQVSGVVYVLTPADVMALDRCEGVPFAYERATCLVRCWDGRRRRVQIYRMTGPLRDIALGAAVDYLSQIRRAYTRLGFDSGALARVRTARVRA